MKSEKNRLTAVTAGVMICFFLFGYCDSVRGATLTDVTSAFNTTANISIYVCKMKDRHNGFF